MRILLDTNILVDYFRSQRSSTKKAVRPGRCRVAGVFFYVYLVRGSVVWVKSAEMTPAPAGAERSIRNVAFS